MVVSMKAGDPPTAKVKPEDDIKALRHEVEYLRQEVEYLKKISAIKNTKR